MDRLRRDHGARVDALPLSAHAPRSGVHETGGANVIHQHGFQGVDAIEGGVSARRIGHEFRLKKFEARTHPWNQEPGIAMDLTMKHFVSPPS